jgi:hypothetical protein
VTSFFITITDGSKDLQNPASAEERPSGTGDSARRAAGVVHQPPGTRWFLYTPELGSPHRLCAKRAGDLATTAAAPGPIATHLRPRRCAAPPFLRTKAAPAGRRRSI